MKKSLYNQKDHKLFCTYIKYNNKTQLFYAGRTSGNGSPQDIIKKRDKYHHINKLGFGEAILDKYSSNKDAIRGREQQLINLFGGAQSDKGLSGNRINGVSNSNIKRHLYEKEAIKEFGFPNWISNSSFNFMSTLIYTNSLNHFMVSIPSA